MEWGEVDLTWGIIFIVLVAAAIGIMFFVFLTERPDSGKGGSKVGLSLEELARKMWELFQ